VALVSDGLGEDFRHVAVAARTFMAQARKGVPVPLRRWGGGVEVVMMVVMMMMTIMMMMMVMMMIIDYEVGLMLTACVYATSRHNRADDAGVVAMQWGALREEFMMPDRGEGPAVDTLDAMEKLVHLRVDK
jgi:hypothetical protein